MRNRIAFGEGPVSIAQLRPLSCGMMNPGFFFERTDGVIEWDMVSKTSIGSDTRALAEQLIALEARSLSVSAAETVATCRVCEKLRHPLVTLTGVAGFSSLLSRALTLAKREAPALSGVEVKPDGSLEGMAGEGTEAESILVGCLLSLLFTFIGEILTMRLLHDVWPDLHGPDLNSLGKESK
jgi:hypothetical protein